MRIEHLFHVKITEDADGLDVLWNPAQSLSKEVFSNMQLETSGKFSIAAAGVETLSLGDVTSARGILIEFDGDANLSLNGGTQVLSILRADTTAGRQARFVMEGTITSVSVTNPAGVTAALTGRYVIWGNPSP